MDKRIIALDLPPSDTLGEATRACFDKCRGKLGLIPNVLLCHAFDEKKLAAFTAMYNELMLGESGLSKARTRDDGRRRPSINHCYYCQAAHGAAVPPAFGDAALGEMMAMNYRAAGLSPRQRPMLDSPPG